MHFVHCLRNKYISKKKNTKSKKKLRKKLRKKENPKQDISLVWDIKKENHKLM